MENEITVEERKTMSIDAQLAAIHATQAAANAEWARHTKQDMDQFTALKDSVTSVNDAVKILDEKIDGLIEREAYRAGEAAGAKKTVVLLATCIPVVISLIGLAVGLYVG
jgi:hypothetical protein